MLLIHWLTTGRSWLSATHVDCSDLVRHREQELDVLVGELLVDGRESLQLVVNLLHVLGVELRERNRAARAGAEEGRLAKEHAWRAAAEDSTGCTTTERRLHPGSSVAPRRQRLPSSHSAAAWVSVSRDAHPA